MLIFTANDFIHMLLKIIRTEMIAEIKFLFRK